MSRRRAIDSIPVPRDMVQWNSGTLTRPIERAQLRAAREKSNRLMVAMGAAVIGFGVSASDTGSSKFEFERDGFFGQGTDQGGADKAGHALSTHIQTALYSAANRSFGLSDDEAALRGAITAWTTQLVVEVADGYSQRHGFSWRDVAANTVGAAFGYLHETNPRFAEIFDYRWEYLPSSEFLDEDGDAEGAFTDYEGSAYVLAVNIGAATGHRREILDLVELQLSYRTRGFMDYRQDGERILRAGIGISLPTVFRRLGLDPVAKVFEYYQPPYTSIGVSLNLDD